MLSLLNTPRRRRIGVAGLSLMLLATMLVGAGLGAMDIPVAQVAGILFRALGLEPPALLAGFDDAQAAVLLSIRLPRVLLAALVGGGLAIAGAAMQGLFRNPLADPGLLGVSSGAALAAFAAIVFGASAHSLLPESFTTWLLPLAAFAGALIALLTLYALSRDASGRVQVPVMLLAGIAVNALCGAGVGLLAWLASDAQLRSFTFWSMGSLGGALWPTLALAAPLIVFATLALARLARPLDLLALGEADAAHLGVRVERLKLGIILLCALIVGVSVSVSGAIGFVGLVVPHVLRMAGGPDHRWLMPASFLGGGILLTIADIAARTWAAPAELPIGILTALVGGPFFLGLLARGRKRALWN